MTDENEEIMNSEQNTTEDRGGGSALNHLLGMVDDFNRQQERLWENARNCAKNNKIPEELPIDAVLFVSGNRFEDLPALFKLQFTGRVFSSNLLQNDSMIIMKLPTPRTG